MNAQRTPPSAADADLLEPLRRMWSHLDAPAPDLAERSLVAIGMDDLDLELLMLQDSAIELTGARGVETARTLTFSGDAVSVMVTITPSRRNYFRLDGWVAPLGGGRVQARHSAGRDVDGVVDREGRFVLLDVPAGLVQLVYHPHEVLLLDALDAAPAAVDRTAVDGAALDGAAPPAPRAVAAPPVRL